MYKFLIHHTRKVITFDNARDFSHFIRSIENELELPALEYQSSGSFFMFRGLLISVIVDDAALASLFI